MHVFHPLTSAPPTTAATEGLTPSKETVVLVTGATNWIGAHVAKALIDAGFSVKAEHQIPNPKPSTLNTQQLTRCVRL